MKIIAILVVVGLGLIAGYGMACLFSASANSSLQPATSTSSFRPVKVEVANPVKPPNHPGVEEGLPVVKVSMKQVVSNKRTGSRPKDVPYEIQVIASEVYPPDSKRIEINLRGEQKLLAYEGDMLVFNGLASAAEGGLILPLDQSSDDPHNYVGTWPVFKKERLYHSRAYDCDMNNCLFFFEGHAIHACQPQDIKKLGSPASHGCIRVHPDLARKLYEWAPTGTMVTVHE